MGTVHIGISLLLLPLQRRGPGPGRRLGSGGSAPLPGLWSDPDDTLGLDPRVFTTGHFLCKNVLGHGFHGYHGFYLKLLQLGYFD